VAFATTVHGYEGSGRGFDVRFRGWLADSTRTVRECTLTEPIRYAAGDPVEVWAFRALLFDAAPPVEPLVADATPETAGYAAVHPETLVADEHLLRAAFGLLVAAHYRTEPDDLARLLDAPNLTLRTLTHDGHVVAVALLAWEGGLSPEVRESMYEGGRVRGNMLPDVLTAQLRDPDAGEPRSLRVVRIAVHGAVRSRGLGSRLLAEIEREFGEDACPATWRGGRGPDPLVARHERTGGPVDYLGVGFGATPELLRFWRRAGYRSLHLATTRNDASGEYSALMARPITPAGTALVDRTEAWLRRQLPAVLSDGLDDCDPAVVAGVLRATEEPFPLDLTDREWRAVAAAAYGNGYFDAAPRPFRRLVAKGVAEGAVTGEDARLLVRRALQARPWPVVAEEFDHVSKRQCVKAFVAALRPLVDEYGGPVADEEAARYR
jgi:tRNA(Met) cytidine acetyltransferase